MREKERSLFFFAIAAGVRAYGGRFCRARSIVRLHFSTRSLLERKKNFGRWITDGRDDGSMNSIQNAILLQSTCHQLFELFRFSIKPDVCGDKISFCHAVANCWVRAATKLSSFKIIHLEFQENALIRSFWANPARCTDQLLRWHFRQAVLANTRGAGEIILEHDFPCLDDCQHTDKRACCFP